MSSNDEPSASIPASRAPRSGLLMMGLILLAMALLAVYTNYQKAHLREIETVTIIAPTPGSSPAVSPSPVAQ